MSLVTIAIPTYDRLEYLKEAVAAARAQTYTNIEILIGDDRAARETQEWVESIAALDARVRYQRNEKNLGMAGNWNALALATRGEFIVIQGDDDRLLPNFVERLISVGGSEFNVAFSNHFLIDDAGHRLLPESIEFNRHYRRDKLADGELRDAAMAVWQNSVPISAALMRTRDVQRLKFKEDLNTPEIELFARLANEGGRFVFCSDYLAEYRTHPASATTNGLRSEALVERLQHIPVPEHVEPTKREFLAALLVDAVSRSLHRGNRDAARRFLQNPYYPQASRGLKPAVTRAAQQLCSQFPAGIGCGAYRLMQRAKAYI